MTVRGSCDPEALSPESPPLVAGDAPAGDPPVEVVPVLLEALLFPFCIVTFTVGEAVAVALGAALAPFAVEACGFGGVNEMVMGMAASGRK